MYQNPTGGDWPWDFTLHKVGERVYIIIKTPTGWNLKFLVVRANDDGRVRLGSYVDVPYTRGRSGKNTTLDNFSHPSFEHIKNMPRPVKRAIRRAYPLARLML